MLRHAHTQGHAPRIGTTSADGAGARVTKYGEMRPRKLAPHETGGDVITLQVEMSGFSRNKLHERDHVRQNWTHPSTPEPTVERKLQASQLALRMMAESFTSKDELLLKEEIERVQLQVDQAKRSYDLNKAAELEYGTLATLQKQLAEKEAALSEHDDNGQEKTLLRLARAFEVAAPWHSRI